MVVFWIIFATIYALMVLAVWCACSFGIAAQRSDYEEKAQVKARIEWSHTVYYDKYWPRYMREMMIVAAWWGFAAGWVWPVTIPLYLAFRKGQYIDQALQARKQLLKENS